MKNIFRKLTEKLEYVKLQNEVKQGVFPRYLYKYSTLNNKYTLDNIISSNLFFQCPLNYNDPYDSQVMFNSSFDLEHDIQITEFLQDFVSSMFKNPKKLGLGTMASYLRNDSVYREEICKVFQIFWMKGVKTTCFTDNYYNRLMWSHYSDHHKGICLEFDVLRSPEIFMNCRPVRYVSHHPQKSFFKDFSSYVNTVLLTKHLDWEYEKEYRAWVDENKNIATSHLLDALKTNKIDGILVPYNPSSLKRVIFGCQATYFNQKDSTELANYLNSLEELIKQVSGKHEHVKYSFMMQEEFSFEIQISKELNSVEAINILKGRMDFVNNQIEFQKKFHDELAKHVDS